MNPALRFILGFEGVTDADAAAIDAALPALMRLDARIQKLDPIIRKVWPEIEPMIRKIWPDLQAAGPILLDGYPDAIAVLPILQRLLQLAKA